MLGENSFVWVDLSSYDPNKTKLFYENVFGWTYYDHNNYLTAYLNNKEVAGLYETPAKFKAINMPSFWMSYIKVTNIQEMVEKARSLGGIVEHVEPDNSVGGIALIRDTLGAGFTVYDGHMFNSRTEKTANTFIFNELHVSNASKAIDFYKELFHWTFKEFYPGSFQISNGKGKNIAALNEIDNSIKSKYEYWTVVFGVRNISETLKKVIANGGDLVYEEEGRYLCSDGSEAFFYIQNV